MTVRLPLEATATATAGLAVFIGITTGIPIWGMFLAWASVYFMGGPSPASLFKLARTMALGIGFAVLATWIQQCLDAAANPATPPWAPAVIATLIVNPCMIALGRLPLFSLIPGIFVGFASYTATLYSSTADHTLSVILATAGRSMTANLLGLGLALLVGLMSKPIVWPHPGPAHPKVADSIHDSTPGSAPRLNSAYAPARKDQP